MFNLGDKTQLRLIILHLLARSSRALTNAELTGLLGLPLHKVNRLLFSMTSEKKAFISHASGEYKFIGNKALLPAISPELSEYISGLKLSDGTSFESDYQQEIYPDETELLVTSLDDSGEPMAGEELEAAQDDLIEQDVPVEPATNSMPHDAMKGLDLSDSKALHVEQNELDSNVQSNDSNYDKEIPLSENIQEQLVSYELTSKEHAFLMAVSKRNVPVMVTQLVNELGLTKDEINKISTKLAEMGLIIISPLSTFNENIYKTSPTTKTALRHVIVVEESEQSSPSLNEDSVEQPVLSKTQDDESVDLKDLIVGVIQEHVTIDENSLVDTILVRHSGYSDGEVFDAIDALTASGRIIAGALEGTLAYTVKPTSDAPPVVLGADSQEIATDAPPSEQIAASDAAVTSVEPNNAQNVAPKDELPAQSAVQPKPEVNAEPEAPATAPTAAPAPAEAPGAAPAPAPVVEDKQPKSKKEPSSRKQPTKPLHVDDSLGQLSSSIDQMMAQVKSMSLSPTFDNHADIKKSLDSLSDYIKALEDENKKWRNFASLLSEGIKKSFE